MSRLTADAVAQLGPDTAQTIGTYRAAVRAEGGKYLFVWRQESGSWRIAADM
jgi:hypothetical protein